MFSQSTQYAIRAVLLLLRKREQCNIMKVSDIAEELNIPVAYLRKILQQLSRNNLVSSMKGRNGGFYLSDENIARPLIDIVICMEGENVFDRCILGLPECGDSNPCHLHQYYKGFKSSISRIFKDVTIQALKEEDIIKYFKL